MKPFPFLGHRSSRSKSIKIWQVLRDGSSIKQTLTCAPRDAEMWDVLLAVWPGKTRGSPWHHESVGDARVLSALGQLVRAAPTYETDSRACIVDSGEIDATVYHSLYRHAPRAAPLRGAVLSMIESTKGDARAVVSDVLLERLPELLGFEFDCDVVIHHMLARLSASTPILLPRSPRFKAAMAARLRQLHEGRTTAPPAGSLDWSDLTEVKTAFGDRQWVALGDGFRETNAGHVETLFAMTHDQRAELSRRHADSRPGCRMSRR